MSTTPDDAPLTADGYGIFVSHITEDSGLAGRLKTHLERAFPGARVFVSAEDIGLGDNWRERLRDALDRARAFVVLCSPRSIRRPWVNFESGGGWARGVPVIPVCHGGLRKDELPDPLKTFQALDLIDERDCRTLVNRVGHLLGLSAAEGYDYESMLRGLFTTPTRGDAVGVVLTHGQDGWARTRDSAGTLFGLRDGPPAGLRGGWEFDPVLKTHDLLSDCLHEYAGLVVGSPRRRPMEPEVVAALAAFVKRGGRMLLLGYELGDRHHDANLNDLAAQFGLYFEADIVGPPGQRASKPYGVAVDFETGRGDAHELTEGLSTIRLANVQTLRVLPLGDEWLRVGDNVACRPARETVEYQDGVFISPGGGKEVEPNPAAGWLPVAAAAPQGLCGDGAVHAVGTWDLLGRGTPFNHRDNFLLLGRLFNWLSGRPVTDTFEVTKT